MNFTGLADAMSSVAFSVLSEPATVISSFGEVPVAGLFTDAIKDGEAIETRNPVGQSSAFLELRPDALPSSPAIGDTVQARGMEFTVVDVTSDACGNIRLILHR